jgi:hypothetical protein
MPITTNIVDICGNDLGTYLVDVCGTQTIAGNKTFTGIVSRQIDVSNTNTQTGTNAFPNAAISTANGLCGTAFGVNALRNQSLNTAINNSAVGYNSLRYETQGLQNTAVGFGSLYGISAGNYNTAIGNYAGIGYTTYTNNQLNDTSFCTFLGANTTCRTLNSAYHSTAVGADAQIISNYQVVLGCSLDTVYIPGCVSGNPIFLGMTVSGNFIPRLINQQVDLSNTNAQFGYNAFQGANQNATGSFSSAFGVNALQNQNSVPTNPAFNNSAFGYNSLKYENSGKQNTAMGFGSLYGISAGNYNTAIGNYAGIGYTTYTNNQLNDTSFCTFLGANTTCRTLNSAYHSTAVGADAQIISNYQVVLGCSLDTVYIPGCVSGNPIFLGMTVSGNFIPRIINQQVDLSNTNAQFGYNAFPGANQYANGSFSSAFGVNALQNQNNPTNTNPAINNNAFGYNSLKYDNVGQNNTAVGYGSLFGVSAGNYNTAIGNYAGIGSYWYNNNWTNDMSFCTFVGANTTAKSPNLNQYSYTYHSTALGADSQITGNYQVVLGSSMDQVMVPGCISGNPIFTAGMNISGGNMQMTGSINKNKIIYTNLKTGGYGPWPNIFYLNSTSYSYSWVKLCTYYGNGNAAFHVNAMFARGGTDHVYFKGNFGNNGTYNSTGLTRPAGYGHCELTQNYFVASGGISPSELFGNTGRLYDFVLTNVNHPTLGSGVSLYVKMSSTIEGCHIEVTATPNCNPANNTGLVYYGIPVMGSSTWTTEISNGNDSEIVPSTYGHNVSTNIHIYRSSAFCGYNVEKNNPSYVGGQYSYAPVSVNTKTGINMVWPGYNLDVSGTFNARREMYISNMLCWNCSSIRNYEQSLWNFNGTINSHYNLYQFKKGWMVTGVNNQLTFRIPGMYLNKASDATTRQNYACPAYYGNPEDTGSVNAGPNNCAECLVKLTLSNPGVFMKITHLHAYRSDPLTYSVSHQYTVMPAFAYANYDASFSASLDTATEGFNMNYTNMYNNGPYRLLVEFTGWVGAFLI